MEDDRFTQSPSCADRSARDEDKYPKATAVLDPLATRKGPFALTYDPDFLVARVDVPKDLTDDSLEVHGSTVIPFTHYCLALSKARRLARWVAWNIDGASLKTA